MRETGEQPDVLVDLGDRSYRIHVGEGSLAMLERIASEWLGDGRCAVVTDRNVARHHLGPAVAALQQAGLDVSVIEVQPGERSKSYRGLRLVHDGMVRARLSRRSLVVAVGGGVVGDLAGFAAATYMRGIGIVQVPASLLAMVDSSVGGKTAINHPSGKNLVGVFSQPVAVVCDPRVLHTLSARDFRSGLAEAVKHGVIADEMYLSAIEARLSDIMARDGVAVGEVVSGSCRIKAAVVSSDEMESGLRAILNYGHTFAHAFEKVGDFRKLRHGEAVALGMVCAGRLSVSLGLMSADEAARVEVTLQRIGLPTRCQWACARDVTDAMALDKKASGKGLRLVVCPRLGTAQVIDDPGGGLVEQAISAVLGPG